jgi:tetratricopeptide (TPR) repeat protein
VEPSSDDHPPLRPETVLALDYRRPLDQIPEEVQALLLLFDGQRTLAQVIEAWGLPDRIARDLVARLVSRQILCEARALDGDVDVPELGAWLGPAPRPRRGSLYTTAAAAFLLCAAGVPTVIGARKARVAPITPPVVPVAPPVVPVAPPPIVAAPVAPPPVAAPPVGDYRALVAEAQALYRNGRTQKAARAAEQALAVRPDGDEALVLAARCALDRGANEQALGAASRAAQANPRNADAQLIVGTVEQQRGRARDARRAYARYLELAPSGAYASEIHAILRTLN